MAGLPAADCHFHVFGDLQRYPLAPEIVHQPSPGTIGAVEQLLAVFDPHGITHGLAVGAGPYGTDNRCLLDGIAASGGRLKERDWFAQVHCGRDQFADAAPVLCAAGVRMLVDHFARPEIARGLDQPGPTVRLCLRSTA